MKRPELLLVLFFALVNLSARAQNQNDHFKMVGQDPKFILVNENFTKTTEITPFANNINKIYGLAVSAEITLSNATSKVEFIFVDQNYNEYLIYETYGYLQNEASVQLNEVCEETCVLNGVKIKSIIINIQDANVTLQKLHYVSRAEFAGNVNEIRMELKKEQNQDKIEQINKSLKEKGKHWVAGTTSVSQLSYSEKKQLFGQSTFPPGFEYYAGGVISTDDSADGESLLKSATATSPYVDEWDWRDRHGINWVTSIKNQSTCGSCWAFAATGATEAMVNLYFNQPLNLDLSEQDLVSCSGAGSCSGGYPKYALDYITSTGIVDENTFPYGTSDLPCENKSTNPAQLIKINGRQDFNEWSSTEDDLKSMLIHEGVLSGGLADWGHAMTLVGYKVVQEGDVFFYRDLTLDRYWKTIEAGDPLIGTTVWIFKNSWGQYFGDEGYVYVETPITNIHWTHAIETPITSMVQNYQVVYQDADGDGYYWWGLGSKPANCPGPDQADGDDSDPSLGPLNEYGYCQSLGTTTSPVADFTAVPREIIEGNSIKFTDSSTNYPTNWEWIFEGGTPSTSTEQNPVVTYITLGHYKVSLTVTNANGNDTKTVDNCITVNTSLHPPIADFTSTATSINTNGSVSFTDVSSNNPTSWRWNFEGGTPSTSTEQNPTVIYSNDGIFDVSLTATNSDGSFTRTIQDYITVTNSISTNPPTADFTVSSTTIEVGQTVSFTDESTNSPTSLLWTFTGGDPATSTDSNPVVTYNSAGTYSASLQVGNDGGSDTKSTTITVNTPVAAPVADFTAAPTVINEGEEVTFTDASSNEPTSWNWTFEGNGTTSTSTEKNPKIKFDNPGLYNISLKVTNTSGSDTKSVSGFITVNQIPVPPVANFMANQTSVNTGSVVEFTDLSDNPETWSWEFPGGSPDNSSEQDPIITYNIAGTYDVTLTVTNADGSDTETFTGYIEVKDQQQTVINPPVAEFTVSSTAIEVGQTVSFTDASTNSPTSRLWTFTGGDPATSTDANPVVTYNSAGTYSVSLEVSNDGGTDTKSTTITVNTPVAAPVADFTSDKTTILENESVNFSDKSLNNPVSWKWDFEGGNPISSTERNPKVTYNSANSFKVTLTVTNAGGKDTKIIENYIHVEQAQPEYCTPTPDASVAWISKVIMNGDSYLAGTSGYTDNSGSKTFSLESGEANSIQLEPGFSGRSGFEYWIVWIDYNSDFEFTNDEIVFQPSKSKSSVSGSISIPANMELTTRMRVAMGSSVPTSCDYSLSGDIEDFTVVIAEPEPQPPVADFAANVYTINAGESVQFADLSANDPTTWQWSFPGSVEGSSTAQNPVITYNTPGTYDVSLTVSKSGFDPSTMEKTALITVKELGEVTYCEPLSINSSVNYIAGVTIGAVLSNQSGADGYSFDESTINLASGVNYDVELVPSVNTSRNFWKIWIDFNNDGDFEDADETLLTVNNIKGPVVSSITIPSGVSGSTRMRISMKTGKAAGACDDGFEGEVEDYNVSFDTQNFGAQMASAIASSTEPGQEFNISVYPNPTRDLIKLKLSEFEEDEFYALYSATGVKIHEEKIDQNICNIDLSAQASGMYILVVSSTNHHFTEKIIKK